MSSDWFADLKVETPLIQWVRGSHHSENTEKNKLEEENSKLEKLIKIYRRTNNLYDQRFTEQQDKVAEITELLEYLNFLRYALDSSNSDVQPIAKIVQANALLRRGQVKADALEDPVDDYRTACTILADPKILQGDNFPHYMAWLQLGKYFRNMGMHLHQSDYYLRASDEFEELLKALHPNKTDKYDQIPDWTKDTWKIYIWLEAWMNLSRTKLYLYEIDAVKGHLKKLSTNIDAALGNNNEDNMLSKIASADSAVECKDMYRCGREILKDYRSQAMLQLGIAYRKNREYKEARSIFAKILNEDSQNVDALNNYALCLRKCWFDLSDAKTDEKNYLKNYELNDDKQIVPTAVKRLYYSILSVLCEGECEQSKIQEQFAKHKKVGILAENILKYEQGNFPKRIRNRFAMLELVRSFFQKNATRNYDLKVVVEFLDHLLKDNPEDRELRLLKGLALQKQGEPEASQLILQTLYDEAPQLSRGTIGLKAYHNMGCNLLAQKQYTKAKTYFETIWKKFQQEDVLSAIEYGWCLMNLGKYSNAAEIYIDILNEESSIIRLGRYNEFKLRNNLVSCYLELLSQEKLDVNKITSSKYYDLINIHLSEVETTEPDNATAARHRGYLMLLQQNYKEAMTYFEKSIAKRHDDIYAHAGWVAAAFVQFEKTKDKPSQISEYDKICSSVKKRILYDSGPYAVKSCSKLSKMVKEMPSDKLQLYRSIARMELGKKEDGYSLFRDLKAHENFRSLKAEARGSVLAILYQLYAEVLELKEARRYDSLDESLVQYRRIDHLKRYLKEETKNEHGGRLTLWNTAYMNDYQEGKCFLDLIKRSVDKDSSLIELYFPEDSSSVQNVLSDSFGANVYTASFSLEKDSIPMWVSYADNAKGCMISYSKDFLNLQQPKSLETDVSLYSDYDFPLYSVFYLDSDANKPDDKEKIMSFLKNIHTMLQSLEKLFEKNLKDIDERNKSVIRQFVRCSLSEIRYLIKDREYDYEKEVRMIHYSKEGILEAKYSNIPKLYIEVDREVHLEKVVLGPKVNAIEEAELRIWMEDTRKVDHIEPSKRHFR